jgi:hypothetical protein
VFGVCPLVEFTKPFISRFVCTYFAFLCYKFGGELASEETGVFILTTVTVLKWIMGKYDKVKNQY